MTDFFYRCVDCGKEHSNEQLHYLCSNCGANWQPGTSLTGVLEVIFDYAKIATQCNLQQIDWSVFSAINSKYYPNYPVGNTPFAKAINLEIDGNRYHNVWLKCDHLNPSGSLKDRASFFIVAQANVLQEEKIVVASTGNAASALAAIAAAAGKQAKIFVPRSAPAAKLAQIKVHGAELILVDGTYDDAFKLSIEETEKHGGLNRNTAYNPLTIEGKKSVGFEIFQQNNCQVPDVILIPVGDGVILSGVYKAFFDLLQAGITEKMPRLIAVQAEGSAVIHNYLTTGKLTSKKATTIADSIAVAAPSNAHLAIKAIKATNGLSVVVSDEKILEMQKLLARQTGQFVEPSSAAVVAGLANLQQQQLINNNDQIVLLLTGHGLKDINSVMNNDENK